MKLSITERSRAIELAYTDPAAALEVADQIEDAWYRSQALATVARHAEPAIAGPALERSRAAARCGKDTYQKATVLAWPLRAALETDRPGLAAMLLAEALAQLPSIELHCSRAESCSILFAAAAPGGAKLWRPLVQALPTLCPPEAHWRAARLYRDVTAILADIDRGVAKRFVAGMPHGSARQRCERNLAAGVSRPPRTFFVRIG